MLFFLKRFARENLGLLEAEAGEDEVEGEWDGAGDDEDGDDA